MKSTLLKAESIKIEGNILFVGGWKHLMENSSWDADQRFSLEPVYNVLRALPYPVIVLKPTQTLVESFQ